MTEIQPFQVMEIWNRARELEAQGKHIVQMQIGEPDFTAPDPVITACTDALKHHAIHYTSALGMPLLRQAISHHYRERYHLDVPASRIAVTAGASGALLIATGVLVNPGDEILMPDPAYPCNRHFVRFFEGRVKSIPVGPQTQYQLTRELIEANWSEKTRGVLIASPSNPTGTMIAPVIRPGMVITPGAMMTKGKPREWATASVDTGAYAMSYVPEATAAASAGDDGFCVIWTSMPALVKKPLSAA